MLLMNNAPEFRTGGPNQGRVAELDSVGSR